MNFDGEKLIEKLIDLGPALVLAIATLIIGLFAVKFTVKSANKAMVKAKVDVSLRRFITSLLNILLKVMVFISVASMLGVEATSFVAVLGAAGLAVGLALQGSLSNFAGGVLILLFKPFRVDDIIETQGYSGKVHSIQVLNTVLKTFDNKTVIIPNGTLANGSITNFTTEATRRVDMTFGIGYGDDLKKAKEILRRLVTEDDRILKDPEPTVVVSGLGESSVDFSVKVWCESGDYWKIYFDMQEKVKLTFDDEGISIPFPQRDVHLYQKQ
ncbi:MAG: mechanosensitive ion channel [Calditrichales bacterium]|nr:MAG: mechanosensitive ion channel [Calditrichales bacterium]